jgi:hypothetical protein
MYRRAASVTVTALGAAAEETYTITEQTSGSPRAHLAALARVGDVVVVNPGPTQEVGWGITKAWVDSEGVIKFSASNFGAGSLDGSTQVVYYAVLR